MDQDVEQKVKTRTELPGIGGIAGGVQCIKKNEALGRYEGTVKISQRSLHWQDLGDACKKLEKGEKGTIDLLKSWI